MTYWPVPITPFCLLVKFLNTNLMSWVFKFPRALFTFGPIIISTPTYSRAVADLNYTKLSAILADEFILYQSSLMKLYVPYSIGHEKHSCTFANVIHFRSLPQFTPRVLLHFLALPPDQ